MSRAAALALLVVSCGTPPQRCTTSSCRGCCFNDVCLDGTSTAACGRGGQECLTCEGSLTCVSGACVNVSGTGGGTAGGNAGGSTAGGSATAGGSTAGGSTAGGGSAGGTGTAGGGSAGGAVLALCDENYLVRATPAQQPCLTQMFPWPNPTARVTQFPDGGLVMLVDAGSLGGATLRGSWDGGGGFRATGQGTMTIGGVPFPVQHTVTAQLATCDAWSGRWTQSASVCSLAWDAGATRP